MLAAVLPQWRVSLPAMLAADRFRSLAALLRSARQIDSDYDLATLLAEVTKKNRLGDSGVLSVYAEAAREIGSSYDRATLLVEIAGKYSLSGAARDAYCEAARSISSNYDRQRAEEALRSGK